MIDRRRFMTLSGGAGAAMALGWPGLVAARTSRFVNPLAIPELDEGIVKDGLRTYGLTVQSGTSRFVQGYETPTIGVNGAYLGPTIRCRVGDRVKFNVRNTLSEPTTVHWHGLHLPARFDGGPHQVIKPGESWEPVFEIKQQPSLCWYHSHLMGRTGEQVLRGLAGLFLIAEDDPVSRGLPHEYGVDDIPLVVQDRRFLDDGAFDYRLRMHDRMMGYHGNVLLVNGTIAPFLEARRKRTRLRILNGSNARIYNFGRDDGQSMIVIGSDGGLLERASTQSTLRLAPGERAEILLDMKSNEAVRLVSYPIAGSRSGDGFPILEIRSGRLDDQAPALADKLANVPAWRPENAQRTRVFELQMGMMGRGRGGGMMGRGMMGGAMAINGRPMDLARIDERVPLGAVEIWEIRNATPLPHPFHIHNIQFRVLDRNGRPPLPQELGLKDTVLVEPGSAVRVITEFADYADPDLPYMYHCHNLEHEDAGMMGQFVVEA